MIRLAAPRLALPALRGLRLVVVALALLLGAGGVVRAQEAPVTERAVKAAFLYKFLGYVDWPANAFAHPDTPISVGVLGSDDVAQELTQIVAGRAVNGRPVTVRRLKEGDSIAGLHVVFVARGERVAPLARQAQQAPALVVTEAPGALEAGSMINFLLHDGRIRFEIAADTAERAGLKLSSRLLAVAQNVRTGG